MTEDLTEALKSSDKLISDLKEHGHDYSSKRVEIAELFDKYLWEGHWDSSTFFEDGTPNLRLIQEDEYDQHMEDRPDYLLYSCGHYVIIEDN